MRTPASYLAAIFLFILAAVTHVSAETFVVTRNDDRNASCNTGDCSLREAVTAANTAAGNDLITFGQGLSLIVLAGELEIANAGTLTISGPGARSLSIDAGTGNSAHFFINEATVTISGLTLKGGAGGDFYTGGGSIFVNQGTLVLDRISAVNNQSFGSGGVVYLYLGSNHRIMNSTFAYNTALSCGAFYNDRGTLTVVNSTFTNNNVNSLGGAFCTDGTTRVRHITVSGNSAELGGGLFFGMGVFNFANSIIAGNTVSKGYPEMMIDNNGLEMGGNNIVGDSSGDAQDTGVPITYPQSDILNTAPLLGPLQYNGGPTMTRALLMGSPAIDAGNNARAQDPHNNTPLLTDQRGFHRIVNSTVDIGAYERSSDPVDPDANFVTPFDYDGDGKADISTFRPAAGVWHLLNSHLGYSPIVWGAAGDRPAPADYDGDGKTDAAVFRAANNTWYFYKSADGTFTSDSWGIEGDLPVPADYNGDGKADAAVYRPSDGKWYIKTSGESSIVVAHWGIEGDKPLIGDFDGDGKADFAVFRPSDGTWYLARSAEGFTAMTWGFETDKPLPADYDGDGKTDIAIYRPATGTWHIVNSGNGEFVQKVWGEAGDVAVPADYDGDRKADTAVYRASNAMWYIINSSGSLSYIHFGESSDVPTPAAFSY